MPLLSPTHVAEKLKSIPGWELSGQEIVRQFTFDDFEQAMAFVNRVARKAEAAGHHPDIDIRYNKVRLGLVSHDAGGLTERDIELAAACNALLG
ncbi:4a-hydroxytetrahydrobiopterin dehydratase [Acidipila rosea]|uniref:Putative pterin-4-alpha-carbinolamine dehydratase n=1 Tax=Acidipila rosea TaxID=768535 RepID=A0A4R1LB23_9BACT|nr:4a-hydroxytetrahydrobiopterin dehydratase [Acidipila rosea]MBW4025781.1 4a-hydroxytetrahydrobiopterin dehydratase [Acidobacteriota bacterium]MBW4044300.1 4a-hydroxytetrahydrobiopterin dehydratase [Acidobacteriota bacterium]TCK75668.1 4a-hydroxytetrahydrobiopterin dehydratase [Acidipila rosea]